MADEQSAFLDGKKTYLTAGSMIAGGIAMQLKAISDGHGVSPEAVQLIMNGLGFLFLRRAVDKL